MVIYVSNIPQKTTQEQLQQLFEPFGEIVSIEMSQITFSGVMKGVAFITMTSAEQARKAIAALNATSLNGKKITVNEARPRNEMGSRPRSHRG
ncbi:MAG: RNA-binding protein [Bacteroidota bacterium]|nr:RNA-binding protein [Bacteroidota bacterium]